MREVLKTLLSPWPMAISAVVVLILIIHTAILYTVNVLHYDIILRLSEWPWISFVSNGG